MPVTLPHQFPASGSLNVAAPLDGIRSVAMTRYGYVTGTITMVPDLASSGNLPLQVIAIRIALVTVRKQSRNAGVLTYPLIAAD